MSPAQVLLLIVAAMTLAQTEARIQFPVPGSTTHSFLAYFCRSFPVPASLHGELTTLQAFMPFGHEEGLSLTRPDLPGVHNWGAGSRREAKKGRSGYSPMECN